jgi:hypothetical protein
MLSLRVLRSNMIKVVKFGGSSLASGESFAKVKKIIEADKSRRIVVVSAPGKRFSGDTKVTDLLYICHAHIKYNAPFDDVLDKIEDRYRENACFIKLTVGKQGKNPNTYGVVLTHGSSKSKDEKWNYGVDGCDCFISGHTHNATHQPFGKIRMDLTHNKVKTVGYQQVVVMPFQRYGGYAVRGKYMPNHLGQFQCITFDGTSKRVGYSYF